ncbi:hypothetical protein CALCODRAFT_540809, partial [Calocera cornea HHB12733]
SAYIDNKADLRLSTPLHSIFTLVREVHESVSSSWRWKHKLASGALKRCIPRLCNLEKLVVCQGMTRLLLPAIDRLRHWQLPKLERLSAGLEVTQALVPDRAIKRLLVLGPLDTVARAVAVCSLVQQSNTLELLVVCVNDMEQWISVGSNMVPACGRLRKLTIQFTAWTPELTRQLSSPLFLNVLLPLVSLESLVITYNGPKEILAEDFCDLCSNLLEVLPMFKRLRVWQHLSAANLADATHVGIRVDLISQEDGSLACVSYVMTTAIYEEGKEVGIQGFVSNINESNDN